MHFLRNDEVRYRRTLGHRWACVTVRAEGRGSERTLIVQEGSIAVLKLGVYLIELPQDVRVLGPDGKQIHASWKFWVTLETFDPFHCLTDMEEP